MSSSWMGPLLVAMGLVAASLAAPATASADEAADSKAKEAQSKTTAAKAKAEDASETGDKADSKAKEATRELADGKDKAADEAKAEDDKAKAEKKKGDPDQGVEEPEAKLPARVPWRGTSVSWSNSVTTSALGVGADFQSGDQQSYTMTFGALLNYFVIDQQGTFRLMINSSPSFTTELTNSGGTTTRREPQFNDLPFTVTGQIPIYSDREVGWWTSTNVRARMFLPTSPASQNDGTYLRTQVGGVLIQGIPMAYKAEHFKAIYLIGALNYFHRFADATTGVNGDLDRPRQGNNLATTSTGLTSTPGSTVLSDQLSGSRIGDDRLSEGLFLFLGEQFGGWTFQLFGGFSFSQTFLNPLDDSNCVVGIDTGPAECSGTEGTQDAPTTRYTYGTSVGLSIFPWPEWGINLGYANSDNSLGADGQRNSIFYNPNSTFSFGMSFSPDALYERATGPRRASPFVIF